MRRVGELRDAVYIHKLSLNALVGPDRWNRVTPQKLLMSMKMVTDFRESSATDDLKYSLDYAKISSDITEFVTTRDHLSLRELGKSVVDYSISKYEGIEALELEVNCPTSHIRCGSVDVIVSSNPHVDDIIVISDLKLLTLVGIFNFERLTKQFVNFNISFSLLKGYKMLSIKSIIDNVISSVENAEFKTVEALVEEVARVVTSDDYFQANKSVEVKIKVLKLNALMETQGVGVSCIRSLNDLCGKGAQVNKVKFNFGGNLPIMQEQRIGETECYTAMLAVGSNSGDRFKNIVECINLLKDDIKVDVIQVSSLFETKPMYFEDQKRFFNGVIEIRTQHDPLELLKLCKRIEYEDMKRVKLIENGPRCIDLDIVMMKKSDGQHVLWNSDELVIPHSRMLERTFVLEPLCELVAFSEVHPITGEFLHDRLKELYETGNNEQLLQKLVPLPQANFKSITDCRFLTFETAYERDAITGTLIRQTTSNTQIMGILNVTPDSFSDGSSDYRNVKYHVDKVKKMVEEALTFQKFVIIDVGGCSTRPGALQIDLQEELTRVIPVIRNIRECSELPQDRIVLSVDTYRSEVAKAAIEAGVDMVNDISGGRLDANMFKVIAANPNIAYVLSHIRGDISNMMNMVEYGDEVSSIAVEEFICGRRDSLVGTELVRNVAREIAESFLKAMTAGVKRWQIILDPGIGFGKTGKQNVEIIKHIPVLKNYSCVKDNRFVSFSNLPVLLGPSRKKFIGTIIQESDAEKRDVVIGAVAASCVGYGVDIFRVHDVSNSSRIIKLADALYRS
ncbi:trifunctional dihydropteroate synthetase/dihydrohydroxymethylpterin pyrophosphokinase/dihydroneopterin aldolase FOL1 Ecym_1119 [Eremothecium cymbalariae DBVPG|uniref:Folic acid synthesis protein fol1 n=1 Tax=Eremothecium cymbalariae (strain CBS 270.75 / DBVPG 7215 / KCTC 17166 / NRRL Y-17582) TaxID=931890 RepID=G8JML8_ERECY|nr:hypothetical protein Ecym_1119 [Eremothecium cymbalariae DBVPG\